MSRISTSQFAKALSRQRALTDTRWIERCDELFLQQRVLFLELVTFGRDGATDPQFRALIDFRSCCQIVAVEEPGDVSSPVELPEFQSAVERATLFFKSLVTNNRGEFMGRMRGWYDDVVSRDEPVVWAACVDTLQQHGIMASPLAQAMVETLYAIADVYSRRFARLKNSTVAAK
jgi:hypothetical protein